MAIVVEQISRGGVVVATQAFDQTVVTIGRGYGCDVILHDPHVDADHIELRQDSVTGSLSCKDNNSLNGSWLIKANRKGGIQGTPLRINHGARFFSGQVFQLGKTYVRIYDDRHHLSPTVPISPWEETAHKLGHWWLWGVFALLFIGLKVWDSYVSLPSPEKLSENFLRACYPILGALVYAGFFAFLGKNYKHDPKLSSHFSVAVSLMLVSSIFQFVAPYFSYWLQIVELRGIAGELLVMALIFVAVYVNLALATPLRRGARVAVAGLAPAALLITLMINMLSQPSFKSYPNYDKNLVEPTWQLRPAKPVDAFLTNADLLFQRFENDQTEEL